MPDTLRLACLVLFALTAMFFVDTPLRTFGQAFTVQRSRARLILLTFELDLVALWGIAVFYARWDRALLPPAAETALAWTGTLLTLAGAGLAVWARFRLGRWFSGTFGVKEGHVLVTDGPYGLVRHPMYTGFLAMLAGAALAHDSALTLVLAVFLAVSFFLHTVYEETLFEQHFGAAYFDYERRVPRLVPFLRPGPRRRPA